MSANRLSPPPGSLSPLYTKSVNKKYNQEDLMAAIGATASAVAASKLGMDEKKEFSKSASFQSPPHTKGHRDYEADKVMDKIRPRLKQARNMGWLLTRLGQLSSAESWGGHASNGYRFSEEAWLWLDQRKKSPAGEFGLRKGVIESSGVSSGLRKRNLYIVGLDEVLTNPEYLRVFEAFLEDNEYDRVTNFLADVVEYRKVRHERTKKAAAQEIFRRHINQSNAISLKLPSELVKQIGDRLEHGDLANDLFDNAYHIIYSRCEATDFRRFVQHSSYEDMLPESIQNKILEDESEKQKGWINDKGYQSLHLDVISGLDIEGKDASKPDVFCIVAVGSKAYKTDMVKSSACPLFENHFELPISNTSVFARVTLWNRGTASKDSLGQVVVYLCDIKAPFLPDWYLISPDEEMNEEDEVCGELHLRFKFSKDPAQESKQALVIDSSSSAISEFVRSKVSKKKKRFDADGFNLDLSYITDHLIAMGFPSESLEGMYRNNMKDVQKFFKTRHPEHYWIYNLCAERSYPPERFDYRVTRYGFEDHNPCPWGMIVPVCEDVHSFLTQHPQNVVCIHCKAGKGRTGLIICAYMLYAGLFSTAEEALIFFGNQRTTNGKGVTIPSQKRWVKYLEIYLKSKRDPSYGITIPENRYLYIRRVLIIKPPLAVKPSSINIKIATDHFAFSSKSFPVTGFSIQDREEECYAFEFKAPCQVPLNGDVKFIFSYGTLFRQEKLFHFWINTRFVLNNEAVLLKNEMDKAVKDTKHQIFEEKLRVKLEFEPVEEQKTCRGSDKEIIQALVPAPVSKAFSFGDKKNKGRDDDLEEKEESKASPSIAAPLKKQGSTPSKSPNFRRRKDSFSRSVKD